MTTLLRTSAVLGLLIVGCGEGDRPANNPSGTAGGGAAGANAMAGSGGAPDNGFAGAAGAQVAPPHTVTACDKLAAPGVWEQITPPGMDLSTFGAYNVLLDTSNTANVFIGTAKNGIQKSTDCGATWVHLDTGTLGTDLDKGSVIPTIDPVNPKVLYTGSLYGTNGFFKSTDGGVNWVSNFPESIAMFVPYGGFIGGIVIDPGPAANANLHVLVTFHDECKTPYTRSCFAETMDGGTKWTLRNGDASWSGKEGSRMQFLDSTHWLFGSESNGLWVSADSGVKWTKVGGAEVAHGPGQLYRRKSGGYFMGTAGGVVFSADGVSWSLAANSGGLITGVVGDGTHVWASTAFPYGMDSHPAPDLRYYVANEADPLNWSVLETPKMSSGGTLAYDADHKLLYSANYWDGVWRVVMK